MVTSEKISKLNIKLDYLDNAKSFLDIQKVPNSYRFHVLKGDLKNYFSYSIDMKYRIIFKYEDDNVHIVEISGLLAIHEFYGSKFANRIPVVQYIKPYDV